ncbi:MAG: hypothetical protein JNL01_01330 [Bdellovibrionales bacterium]|nr:hypothetical protein [Bdellovibrionales bacterium]
MKKNISPHFHFFQALSMAIPLALALAAAYGSMAEAGREGSALVNRIEQQNQVYLAKNDTTASAVRNAEIITGDTITETQAASEEAAQVSCNGDACVSVQSPGQ